MVALAAVIGSGEMGGQAHQSESDGHPGGPRSQADPGDAGMSRSADSATAAHDPRLSALNPGGGRAAEPRRAPTDSRTLLCFAEQLSQQPPRQTDSASVTSPTAASSA